MTHFTVNCLVSNITSCGRNWVVDVNGVYYHRLYYVYDGEVAYKDCEQTFALKKGCLYLFPIQKKYSITHNPEKPFKCLWFHVMTTPRIINTVASLDVQNEPIAHHLLKALESLHDGPESNNGLKKQLLESLMFFWDSKSGFFISNDERLATVLGYIHDHDGENLSNTILSEVVSLDVYYFIRIFKKTFGVTPQKYTSDYRLQRALGMLQNGMLVGDVSEKSGYQDPKSFSRAFKKYTGVPPSKCRPGQFLQP